VAQVVARELGITDASLINVKASTNFVGANNDLTGGSTGSDCSAIVMSLVLLIFLWEGMRIIQLFL